MPISQAFLGEFDHEMANTRKTLERVPLEKFDWVPHEKSMKMGALANHLTDMPGWIKSTLENDSIDVAGFVPEPPAKTTAELLARFDKNVAAGRAALVAATDDSKWMANWSLKNGDQVMFSMPKVVVMRGFVFNHNVHHRAQMGVYLRLNNIAVPSIYGPSADEGKF
jgi:uncharacterized damage-inducible protein DinB